MVWNQDIALNTLWYNSGTGNDPTEDSGISNIKKGAVAVNTADGLMWVNVTGGGVTGDWELISGAAGGGGSTTLSGLTDTVISSLSSAHILVYDGSNSWDNKAVSGDVSMANTGAVTISSSAVTLAKMANLANLRVIGRVTGSAGAPQAVTVFDEDNMASDSASGLATQQSIKSYVDDSAYTHPTNAGNVHIPTGGTADQFLKYSGTSGIAVWAADNDTTYSVGDNGLTQKNFTLTLKTKLDGIATSANNYVHPTTAGNVHIPAGGESLNYLKWSALGTAIWADVPVYSHPGTNGYKHVPQDGSVGLFLKYTSAGTAVWAADNDTTYTVGDGGLTQKNFTLTLKTKLDGIASSANNYSHPTTAANKHVPGGGESLNYLKWSALGTAVWADVPVYSHPTSNGYRHVPQDGSSGLFLKYTSEGAAVWAADNNTTYSVGDGGLTQINFTSADNTKLDGIAASANNYSHPTSNGNLHIPVDGANNQFLKYTSAGTAVWAADNDTTYSVGDGGLTQINFTSADNTKLDGIAASANNYTHPTNAGNKHIPTGGATDQFLKYSSSGTAVWAAATGSVQTGVASRVAYYPSSNSVVNDHASMTFVGGASPSAYEINIVDAVLDINGHTDSRIIIPVGTNKWAT
jgi:hypothetical protein